MHRYTEETERLAQAVVDYALERARMDPPSLDHPRTEADLRAHVGATITPQGMGGLEALRLFVEELAPANISVDHPRFLAFVPAAPTKAAMLFDAIVGVSALYGGSWLEASGAVYAENEALAWVASLVGLPPDAGGTFVSGGTAGNLSALVAARHAAASRRAERPARWRMAASDGVHSSVDTAARVMDVDVLHVPADERGRLTGPNLRAAIERAEREGGPGVLDGLFAVVATGGTTNAGVVDDLAGVADVCAERGLWLHVDGAYGGAALAAPEVRPLFRGVERCDSFIVDPHKWFFSTFDCCALLYRDPEVARAAHTQSAAYLDTYVARQEWNPSDYAIHLSRRARGLPFWFSLATHGTDAYRVAVETTLRRARDAAQLVEADPRTELLLEPELTVVLFRRTGWGPDDYQRWSDRVLAEGLALCTPTRWRGETVLRFCIVNPRTTREDIQAILASMDRP